MVQKLQNYVACHRSKQKQIGLRTYVKKYGQMSEDVAVGEDHVEFADSPLVVPVYIATVTNMLS